MTYKNLHIPGFVREIALQVASIGSLYVAVRIAVQGRVEEARNRAVDVLNFEDRLGVAWEKGIQESVLRSEWVVDFFNYFYFWGHFPFIILLAFFLWVNNKQVYVKLRNAILVSALIAIACYFIFPTAPPRLITELGFVDTLIAEGAPAYQSQDPQLLVNPYAAIPSLHIGFAVLIFWAFYLVAKQLIANSITKITLLTLGALIPTIQTLAVIATANHWIFDVFTGVVVATVAIVVESHFAKGLTTSKNWLTKKWKQTVRLVFG